MKERTASANKQQTAKKLAAISMEHLKQLSPAERKKKLKAFEDAVKRAVSYTHARRRELVRTYRTASFDSLSKKHVNKTLLVAFFE